MLLETQKRLNDAVMEYHNKNATSSSIRKCYHRPKGYVPEKSPFEYAVEKRYNVNVHTVKPIQPELQTTDRDKTEPKTSGRYKIPKIPGQDINISTAEAAEKTKGTKTSGKRGLHCRNKNIQGQCL
jgi:hypothetical protein